MARDGVRGKKSTDLVVYVINEATKLLKGTSVIRGSLKPGTFISTSNQALQRFNPPLARPSAPRCPWYATKRDQIYCVALMNRA